MYKLKNPNENIKYFINTNGSVLYIYNTKVNKVNMVYSNKFGASKIEVIKITKDNTIEKNEDIKTILKDDNDFIEVVEVIASTNQQQGYFKEFDKHTNIETNYLNIYLNSVKFIEARNNNKFKIDKDNSLISILENQTPTILLLLRNLFDNENDMIFINFINYLNVVAFQNNRQDVMWLFKGTNEDEQGQGSGKGVLRDLLNIMFNGLTCSVSNETYNDKFNSELLNKKIVIFDEINFKTLKYDKLKDITGNSTLRIENKGKDAIIVDNVSSWFLFTNGHSLDSKIKIDDRRTFIINPTPKNGSLKREIIDKLFHKDYKSFENKLFSEIENFIHILALVPGKVKTPLEIQSKAHQSYFNVKKTLVDIGNIIDVFSNEEKKNIFIDFMRELYLVGDIEKSRYINLSYFLKNKFYYQNIFEVVFEISQEHKICNVKPSDKQKSTIKVIKDMLQHKEYELYSINTSIKVNDMRQSLKMRNCLRPKSFTKKDQNNINAKLKSIIIEQSQKHPPF